MRGDRGWWERRLIRVGVGEGSGGALLGEVEGVAGEDAEDQGSEGGEGKADAGGDGKGMEA